MLLNEVATAYKLCPRTCRRYLKKGCASSAVLVNGIWHLDNQAVQQLREAMSQAGMPRPHRGGFGRRMGAKKY